MLRNTNTIYLNSSVFIIIIIIISITILIVIFTQFYEFIFGPSTPQNMHIPFILLTSFVRCIMGCFLNRSFHAEHLLAAFLTLSVPTHIFTTNNNYKVSLAKKFVLVLDIYLHKT